jgi:CheY-like chemotaxis protein
VLIELVNGVLTTLVPVASGHGVQLKNQLPNDLPLVRANRVVVRQGLMGLLSYALQRLQEGQITIEGKTIAGRVELWIILEGAHQPNEPGSLGLDVSRKLLASLGGNIEIDAQPGIWRIKVNLPGAEELPILLMDDNAGMIELFRRYLAGRGYRVLEAHTADEAISIARKLDLKLVILDVMMPEQDGWEILQRLKAAPETQTTPVMICSVLNEPEIASTLGASDYLPKPVTQDDLLAKVERWCRAPILPAAPPTGSPANISRSR